MFNPWQTTEDGQRRKITYTVSINHAIGPKHSPTTEQQVALTDNKVISQFKIIHSRTGKRVYWLDIQPHSRNYITANV